MLDNAINFIIKPKSSPLGKFDINILSIEGYLW